ncbi:MAG: serine hydrolase domain-containing protein [Xanthobacteraceae bacterium]
MDKPTRRGLVTATAKVAAAGCIGVAATTLARAGLQTTQAARELPHIDSLLRTAVSAGEIPGVVALAAGDSGVVYEGVFGWRRLGSGQRMTRDTVFRIASMVKVITTVAALQLVEQGKLSLDAPVPDIDPALGAPQVLEGFNAAGRPELRPAKRPVSLRQLLTHTAGFTYKLWDAKAVRYSEAIDHLPQPERSIAPRKPLMFDPGERWQYGPNIDWVGRIVELISGVPLEVYFHKHIFDPLGMNDTAFVISAQQRLREASVHRREPDGSLLPQPVEKQTPQQTFFGGGGIYSTAPDYLTFVRMLMHGGSLDGTQILRPETVSLMGENQIGEIDVGVLRTTQPSLSNDVDLFPDITRKWGFGHLINMQPVPNGRGAGSLTWGGLFNTYYWIDPARRIASVFMTQVLPFADVRALRIYRQFERGIYLAANAG